MRKIKKSEIKNVSAAFTEIFSRYEAYGIFFTPDRMMRGIYYMYRYEIHCSANYTYASEDGLSFASVKRPGDKDRSPASLFVNPFFTCAFFGAIGGASVRKAGEYIRMAEKIAEKYYNPSTDCYIKNIGVSQEARGQGRLRKMIDELCGDAPVYLETHDPKNVAIYEHLGFKVCETAEFYGYKHYAMKRDGKNSKK